MGYFDFMTVKKVGEEGVRHLPEDSKQVILAWLNLFDDLTSARDVREQFHKLAFGGE